MTIQPRRAARAFALGACLAAACSAFAQVPEPPASSPLSGILAIAAGGHHTCALARFGTVLCWGANYSGQLGDGTFVGRAGPAVVPGLSNVVAIAAGYEHTCALDLAGAVKCWGFNIAGQVGDGSTKGVRATPADVIGLTSGVVAIGAGGLHSCAVTTAGGVKCWGFNAMGELGDGTTTTRRSPVDVLGLSGPAVAVAPGGVPGGTHTCAVTAAGRVNCWGANFAGQLGDGTTTSRTTAVEVAGLSGAIAVDAGSGKSCALTASGGLKCWGGTPADAPGLESDIGSFSMRRDHTCVVTSGGGARCVGNNGAGQLGDGTLDSRSLPVDVTGLTAGVAAVTTGASHSCALMATSEVRCWGAGWFGELGDGVFHATAHPSPVVVRAFVPQSITFGALAARGLAESPFEIAASASSGLPVTFTSLTPHVCTVSGSTVTLVAYGACSIAADQPGDADFLPAARVGRGFVVREAAAASVPRLGNIAARARAGSKASGAALIAGFVIDGPTPKTIVVRARGPSLTPFGVANVLADPSLELFSAAQQLMGQNDDWRSSNLAADTALESIGLAPSDEREAAVMVTLGPGAYTAIVSSAGDPDAVGVALVEVFEVDRPEAPLVNISTRGLVGTGNEVMIGGFVIQGEGPQTVIVRARGPSLAPFGIANPLANPAVELVRSSDGAVLAANDNWIGAPNRAAIEASGFAPSHFFESAILVTLPPGAYTAIVRGADGATGVGIMEVFAQ